MRHAIVLSICIWAVRADADPLEDLIAHHDLEGLRARLPSPAASCGLSLLYAERRDVLRAALHLDGCDETALPAALRDDASRSLRKLRKQLKDSQLSELYIDTKPGHLPAEIDALPGEHFTTPITVWVPAGTHVVTATSGDQVITNSITTKPHSSAHLFLGASVPNVAAPKAGRVSFEEGGDLGDHHDAPPPDQKHGTLMPIKYLNGGTTGGEQIDDPLEVHERRSSPRYPPALRIGLRAGIGVFGHRGGSRIAPSIALAGRIAAPWETTGARRPFELGLRVDWSRRGGDDMQFDVIGGSLEVAKVVLATDSAWIELGGSLRGDVRTGAMVVHGTGVSAGASVELALRDLPIVVGVRYEQGLSELAPGAREHAILVEAGADLRRFRYRR